ncbi:MAG: PQQ-binding-like beta-propeller repeat protein [Planctomycetota bacterium]
MYWLPQNPFRQPNAVAILTGIRGGRILLAGLLVAAVIASTFRNAGVREIDRVHEPANFAVVDARPAPGDWPWWRGADQSNAARLLHPPAQWIPRDSRSWVAPVTGHGRTALCSWGQQLFLPTIDKLRETVSMQALESSTGRLLWQTELHCGGLLPIPARGSQTSTTPACDGRHVYIASAVNGSLWVSAIDLTGRIVWQREAGPYYSKWGYSSSPTIYKSMVIVAADNRGTGIDRLAGAGSLVALHRHTGEIVWRIRRPAADSLGTPVVAKVAGRDQLLLAGKGQITSYDPATGKSLWSCNWSAERAINSVAFDDQHVYASARQPRPEMLCIRADGSGDVTRTNIVWRTGKAVSDGPSPVVFDGALYYLSDDGFMTSLNAATGQPLWKRRLGGTCSASPLIAGNHLYCCNEEGTVFVIRLGTKGELVAQIPLGEPIFASPIASEHRLYIRTLAGLHCISSNEETPLAIQPEATRGRG